MFLFHRISWQQTCITLCPKKGNMPDVLLWWVFFQHDFAEHICVDTSQRLHLCAKPSSLVLCAHQKLMLFLFLKCGFCSQLLEAQADYHRKALAVIEKVLPEIQAHQGKVTCALADASPCLCHLCTMFSSCISILLHADWLNKAILIYLTILHSQA